MSGPPDLTEAFERSGLIDVSYVVEDSPVGRLLLAATGDGLVCLHYVNRDDDLEQSLEQLARAALPAGAARAAPARRATPRARRVLRRPPPRLRHPARLRADQAGLHPPRARADRADPVRRDRQLQGNRRPAPATSAPSAPPARRSDRTRCRSSCPATACCTPAAVSAATPAGSISSAGCSRSRACCPRRSRADPVARRGARTPVAAWNGWRATGARQPFSRPPLPSAIRLPEASREVLWAVVAASAVGGL